VSLSIRHHIPGRTRLSFARWPRDEALGRANARLADMGCTVAACNPRTGSLLVLHPGALSAEALRRLVAAALLGEVYEQATPSTEPNARPLPRQSPDSELLRYCALSGDDVLTELNASFDGLSGAEATRRLATAGRNVVSTPTGRNSGEILLGQISSLPVALLLGSAVLSVVTGGFFDAAVTVGVVAVNAAIGFSSENATEQLIRRLSRPIEHAATVLRDGDAIVVNARDVVPGDIIVLSPGAVVAADARVLDAQELSLDESMLTGESLPVIKTAEALVPTPGHLADRANILHAGTIVTGGDGRAVVIATGRRTEMARTRDIIGHAQPPRPAVEEKLARLGTQLTFACLGISAFVFGVGMWRGEPLLAMAKSAIALAVSAIPEGLPAVATTTLALGAQAMERERVLVRVLPAIEAVGGVDTICLDKTGTLTENRMKVVAAHVADRVVRHPDGDPWHPGDAPLIDLAKAVALCSEAATVGKNGSATELALLDFAVAQGVDVEGLRQRCPVLAVRNRNHSRRWMATEHADSSGHFVVLKGAPDEVLAQSTFERLNGELHTLDPARRAVIRAANEKLAGEGLRILGVASRAGPLDDDASSLVWLGLVALADPVRAEAREAIEVFHRAGIRTIMITGDQPATALAVASTLKLSRSGTLRVVQGAELTGLDDHALGKLAEATSVFARVSPADKLRIVRALQAKGHRVAMIGDGINDGPALRMASVGVAMGRNATNVAREVADLVIADDDLRQLARAIARGRATEDNIRTAVQYFLSTNLSEVLVMLIESLHGRGELETPMELFWLNLMTDVLPALGLALAEPRGDVMSRASRKADVPMLDSSQAVDVALDAGGIAAAALTAHFTVLSRVGVGGQTRSATFLTLALGQVAHAWVLRDRSGDAGPGARLSARRLEAALAAAGVIGILPFFIPSLGRLLGLGPLNLTDVATSITLAGASFGLAEMRRITAKAPGTASS
jgi:Ca2+-transporting ATPase